VQEQEQPADTVRRAIARKESGVREQEQPADTVRQAIAREEPGVLEHESLQQAAAREEPGVQEQEQSADNHETSHSYSMNSLGYASMSLDGVGIEMKKKWEILQV